MDTARLLTQLPVIMSLSSAALLLILLLISLSSPLPTLCLPSPYSLPALKSMCVEYACSMWSLLHHSSQQPDVLISSRHLFLLVNIIILFLLISLHLHQPAPPAADKRSSRKKKQQLTEKLVMNDTRDALLQSLQEAPLADDHTGLAAAAMVKEALSSSVCAAELDSEESLLAEAAPMQESSMKNLDEAQEFQTVDYDSINGSDVEQIVLEEDGRLRFMGGGDTDGSDAEKSELGLTEFGNDSDAEKIVPEEDGRPTLIEPIEGSDEEKIVLEEDGRLRLIDRPQLPSSSRPQKSHSTGDKNVTEPSDRNHLNGNSDTHSLDIVNDDNHTQGLNNNDIASYDNNDIRTHSLNNHHDSLDKHSLNHDTSNFSELNTGTLVLDLSSESNASISNNLNHNSSYNNKSTSIKRTSSRPMRAKKSESLDATWKAIHNNKGSAGNTGRDHKRPLIRQRSRQDFKPASRGLMKASSKVRREPSIGQEELNAKVESFIARFNEQIRIQRQQSLISYMQMVDRGAK